MREIDMGTQHRENDLDELLAEYFDMQESGQWVSQREFLERSPRLRPHLETFFEQNERIGRLTSPLRSAVAASMSLENGCHIGDFVIGRELGRGGMGIVYEAEQLSLHRHVALKVLPLVAALDSHTLKRFNNESQAAASLEHPHIVPVYTVGFDQGVHYFAMQLIDGVSLAESAKARFDSKSNTEACRTIADWGVQAAEALHHAHREGIVHRDIKPSNLLVDRTGKLWVTDFGLARIQACDDVTVTGDMVGTLRYMSPEQLDDSHVADHRSDVYSLGTTLYEILLQRPAFTADSRGRLIHQILNGRPDRPRTHNRLVPLDLETIILKAMDKEPENRYTDANTLAQDLRRFSNGSPVLARRTRMTELLKRWATQNPLPAGLAATVFALLLLLTVTTAFMNTRLAEHARNESNAAEQKIQQIYAKDIKSAQVALKSGDLLKCERILQSNYPIQGELDRRGFEWFYLWQQSHAFNVKVQQHGLAVYSGDVSPNAELLATGSFPGRVTLWDISSGKRVSRLKGHGQRVMGLKFVEDGKTILSASRDGTVRRWIVASGKCTSTINVDEDVTPRLRGLVDCDFTDDGSLAVVSIGRELSVPTPGSAAEVSIWNLENESLTSTVTGLHEKPVVQISPNQDILALGDHSGTVRILDIKSGKERNRVRAHDGLVLDLTFSPDGQRLATSGETRAGKQSLGQIRTWNAANWQMVSEFSLQDGAAFSMAYSPDGETLALGSRKGTVSIWRTQDQQLVHSFPAHTQVVTWLCFSPDGQTLCTGSADTSSRIWPLSKMLDAESLESSVSFGNRSERKHSVAFAEHGQAICLAYRDGEVEVADSSTGQVRYSLPGGKVNMADVAVSRDSQYLAVASGTFPPASDSPGEVRLHELATGREIFRVELPHGYVRGLDFSPDGRQLGVASAEHCVLLEVSSGSILSTMGPFENAIKCLRFHPFAPTIALATPSGTHLVDLESRATTTIATDDGPTEAVAFSPDGKYFATGGSDRMVKLWETSTGKRCRELSPAGAWVLALKFTPDGKRVVASLMNGHVLVLDVESGEPLLDLLEGSPWVLGCDVSRDGSAIAASGVGVSIWTCGNALGSLRLLSVDELTPICITE